MELESKNYFTRALWVHKLIVSCVVVCGLLCVYRHFFFPWHHLAGGDIIGVHAPFLFAFQRQLEQSNFPMWFPEICAGVPAIPDINTTLLHPIYQTLRWWSVPTVLKLQILLHALIYFWGNWAWLKASNLKSSHALIWSVVSLVLMPIQALLHFGHLGLFCSVSVLPWILKHAWCLGREQGRYHALSLGCWFGFLWVVGHPQLSLWIHELALVFVVTFGWRRWRVILPFAFAVGIGVCLALPQLLPTALHILESERMDSMADRSFLASGSLGFLQVIRWLHPQMMGNELTYWGQHTYWFGVLFSSPLILLMFLNGFSKLHKPFRWMLVMLMILSLGYMTPLYAMHQNLVPGARLFRYASRFLLLTGPFVVLAVAKGWSVVSIKPFSKRTRTFLVLWCCCIAVFPFLPNTWLSSWFPERVLMRRTWGEIDLASLLMVGQVCVLWLSSFRWKQRLIMAGFLQFLMVASSTFSRVQGGSWTMIDAQIPLNPVIKNHDNRGMVLGLETLGGYVGMSPDAYRKFLDTQAPQDFSKRNRMQVEQLPLQTLTYMEIQDDPKRGRHRVSIKEGSRYHFTKTFSPLELRPDSLHTEAIRETQASIEERFRESFPQTELTGLGTVEIQQVSGDRVELMTFSKTPQVLVGLENHHPLWKAHLNGAPMTIHPWLGTFRAIFLPAGEHRLTLSMDRRPLNIGFLAQVMMATLLALFFLLVRLRKPFS